MKELFWGFMSGDMATMSILWLLILPFVLIGALINKIKTFFDDRR